VLDYALATFAVIGTGGFGAGTLFYILATHKYILHNKLLMLNPVENHHTVAKIGRILYVQSLNANFSK